MTRSLSNGHLGSLCLALAALSCSAAQKPAASAPQAPPVRETAAAQTSPPDLGYHMRASFWDTLDARDALIAGELERAKRAADHLAKTDYARLLPQDWMRWVSQLQQHALELSMAANMSDAGRALGRLALVCGECHELYETGPNHPRVQPRPWEDPPDELDARMHRHQLGMAQMWDGLVLPSEQAFRSGTVTVTRAPLSPPQRAGEPIDPTLQARIETVRELARAARRAPTYQERGRVYGDLVARCADCHYSQRPDKAPRGTAR